MECLEQNNFKNTFIYKSIFFIINYLIIMNKIFNITLLFSIIWICLYAYFYYTLGLEWSKLYLISFTNKTWTDIIFFKEFYYYMGLFLSLFFLPFSLMMSWRISIWYVFLVWSFVFWSVAYFVEMVRIPFIIPTLAFFWVFWLFTITPRMKKGKLKRLKIEWLEVEWTFIDTITDYTVKVNGRPRIKAIIDVINPHSWKLIRIESDGSFDPYFWINMPKKIKVYFDRHNQNIYICDI